MITEIGLIIHSSELAKKVLKTVAVDLQPENAWQVLLEESANTRHQGGAYFHHFDTGAGPPVAVVRPVSLWHGRRIRRFGYRL